MAAGAAGSMENVKLGFIPSSTSVISLGGTTLGYLESDVGVDVAQERSSVRPGLVKIESVVISRDLMVAFSIKEILLEHLQYAWDTDAPAVGPPAVLTLDEDVGTLLALLANTYAPNGDMGERVVSVPKAVAAGGGSYNIPRATGGDSNQTLAMQFEAVGDTASNGLLGTVTDTYA